ncbi:hypothetical protein MKW92_001285 [Papaver armeniacum]|nr:hypothetical protein MKW92_001285 [Papaver armeniacum]
MAAHNNKSSSSNFVSIAIMALLFVALVNNFANASSMTVYNGPGCDNGGYIITDCGCSSIFAHGGYNFNYGGQTAALYNEDWCTGVAHTRLHGNAGMCSGFGWQSIFIQC